MERIIGGESDDRLIVAPSPSIANRRYNRGCYIAYRMLGCHIRPIVSGRNQWPVCLGLMKRSVSVADMGCCASSEEPRRRVKRRKLSDVFSTLESLPRSHAPPPCQSQLGGNVSFSGRPTASVPNSKPSVTPPASQADKDGLWLIVGLGNPCVCVLCSHGHTTYCILTVASGYPSVTKSPLMRSLMAISDDKISGYSHLFIYLISYLQSIDCPGSNYDRTRHNVGFMVIDTLARSEGIECRKLEKSAAVGRGEIGGQTVLLVKPVTFMNNSGESVSALAKFYKVPPTPLLSSYFTTPSM